MSKAFAEVGYARPDDNVVMLVDALNLAFRYKHKRQRNFGADYLRTIDSLANSYGCNKVIVCADKGQSSYRTEVDPLYKANRKEKRKNQSEEEKQQFFEFIEDYEKALELVATIHPILRFQDVEADDVIAVISQNKLPETKIWIISTDRDLDQLINPEVNRWAYNSRKEITIGNFEEFHGCTPEEYISIKVLQGDTGDNVPGIAGVGEKRALGLLRTYDTAFDVYDAIPLPGKLKYIQAVNESGTRILTNYELMDLCFSEQAVGEDNMVQVKELMNELRI